MPDFSLPNWITQQHSFADSLMKGAQVGAIIANNRYRNQALAAQSVQAEREYALREQQVAAQMRTTDLNFQLQSQLVEDQSEDKAAITSWIQERNRLPLEERLSMDLPALKLPQSYEIANKMIDNDRLTFERSLKGRTQAALALRLAKIPADYIQRFEMEPDWDSKMQILAEGEATAQANAENLRYITHGTQNPDQYAPGEVQELKDPSSGKVLGHAMWNGRQFVRIPEMRESTQADVIKYRALWGQLDDTTKGKAFFRGDMLKRIEEQEASIRKQLSEVEQRLGGTATSAPSGISIPTPTSQAERDALPSGTRYQAPDGSIRIRP